MTTPITIPESADEMFDISSPTTPINQLFRWYNEFLMSVKFGERIGVSSLPKKYDGTRFVTVDNIDDAIIQPDSALASLVFWNQILDDISRGARYFAKRSIVDDPDFEGGQWEEANTPIDSCDGLVELLVEAGMDGIERRNGESIDDPPIIDLSADSYEIGDIIGPWMFRDIAKLLSQLRYRQVLLYDLPDWRVKFKYGVVTNNTRSAWDYIYDYIRGQWEELRIFSQGGSVPKYLYVYQALIKVNRDGIVGIGTAQTSESVPYINYVDTRGLEGTLDIYGRVSVQPGYNLEPSEPFPDINENALIKYASMDAPTEDGYLDYFYDVEGATFPFDWYGFNRGNAPSVGDDKDVSCRINNPIGIFVADWTYEYNP